MSAADRIASAVAEHLFEFRRPTAARVTEALRGHELSRSVGPLAAHQTSLQAQQREEAHHWLS
jgi:hypothetical protein